MAGEGKRVRMKGVQRDLCDRNAEANNGTHQPCAGTYIPSSAGDIFYQTPLCLFMGAHVGIHQGLTSGGDLKISFPWLPLAFRISLALSSQLLANFSLLTPPPRLLLSSKGSLPGLPFPALTLSSSVD